MLYDTSKAFTIIVWEPALLLRNYDLERSTMAAQVEALLPLLELTNVTFGVVPLGGPDPRPDAEAVPALRR